jgi:L-fuculose-phosphate aldolase
VPPTPAEPPQTPPGPAAASLDDACDEARAALVRYGQRMVADRLVVGSAGNISVRVGDRIVMTPTGVNYDQVTAESVNVLGADGTILAGTGQRSSEWPMHRKIYDLTPASAVVHTHSVFSVAVGTICDEIPAVHYSVLVLGGPTVRVAPYTTFGSAGLAGNVAAALEDRFAALLQNHGMIAYGSSLAEAYERAQLVEWLAEVYWRARLAGTPRILDRAELDAVREQARRHRDRGGGHG